MGNKITLQLDKREVTGKKVASLRKEGIIPGVVYGQGFDPINVQVPMNIMTVTYRDAGTYTPVHLTIEGKKKLAMIKEVDIDPVRRTIDHVSFHAIKQGDSVVVEVPVKLVGEGESEAEKNGLIVLQSLNTLEIKALPGSLPDALEVSILNLKEANDHVTVADISIPEGVEVLDHAANESDDEGESHSIMELTVATVYEPSALQAANDAAGGDAEEANADAVESENGDDTPQGEQDPSQASGDKDGK